MSEEMPITYVIASSFFILYFVACLTRSLYCIYQFYVDERKQSGDYNILLFYKTNHYVGRGDYISIYLCVALSEGLLLWACWLWAIAAIALFQLAPVITSTIVTIIVSVVLIAKVHKTVNSVRYKLSDHVQDKNAHK